VKAVIAKEKAPAPAATAAGAAPAAAAASGGGDIADSEKILLFEFLIHISNAMPDRNQQHTFVAQLLQSSMAVWSSSEYVGLVSSSAQFSKLFGFKVR
jgi:hypothetical protein